MLNQVFNELTQNELDQWVNSLDLDDSEIIPFGIHDDYKITQKVTHIIQIYDSIIAKEELDNDDDENGFVFRPERCEEYTVPPFRLPECTAKGSLAKQNINLAKALAFVHCNQQRRYKDCCTVMPVPSTNRKYISICGNERNVRNLRFFLQEIGLIAIDNDAYNYIPNNDGKTLCKTYRYYVENEIKLIEICKERNITMAKPSIQYFGTPREFASFDNNGVRFSSVLHLEKPEGMSKDAFNKELLIILSCNYPQLIYYTSLAMHINSHYYQDYPSFEIQYEPKFTYDHKGEGNGWVHKIGIRATNDYCNCKDLEKKRKQKKKKKNSSKITRQEVLTEHSLNLHYDVSSSVPRLTLSIHSGYWVSEEEVPDIYINIYCRYVELNKVDNICTLAESSKMDMYTIREAVKKLFMFAYFDNTSDKNMGNHVRRKMLDKNDKTGVYQQMAIFRRAVEDTVGQSEFSEIFFHESNIYMEVTKQLLDEGFFVWQVYDSWYARKDGVTQEEFQKHVSELVEEKTNTYIQRMHGNGEWPSLPLEDISCLQPNDFKLKPEDFKQAVKQPEYVMR